MAWAMKDLKRLVTDHHDVALVEPMIGRDIAGGKTVLAALGFEIVEEHFVGAVGAFDLDLQAFARSESVG